MAKLYFRYGAMNSGKSTLLSQAAHNYEERGQKVLVLKPSADTKSEKVLSRIGLSRQVDINVPPTMNVREVLDAAAKEKSVNCVLVDEAQFMTRDQIDQLFWFAVQEDIPVIAYGLRTDFRTNAFPGSARLLEMSHSIEELKTICRCGKKAVFNGRKIDGAFVNEGDQVAIDGDVDDQAVIEYESLCGKCYCEKVGI